MSRHNNIGLKVDTLIGLLKEIKEFTESLQTDVRYMNKEGYEVPANMLAWRMRRMGDILQDSQDVFSQMAVKYEGVKA